MFFCALTAGDRDHLDAHASAVRPDRRGMSCSFGAITAVPRRCIDAPVVAAVQGSAGGSGQANPVLKRDERSHWLATAKHHKGS